jgi:tetratricopeptide (TPR) repeat protein
MRRNLFTAIALSFLVIPVSGCAFFDELGAVRTFKDANIAYGRGFYEEAIELYEEVLEVIDASGGESELAQNLTPAYFYIANSYDNLYPPGGRDAESLQTLDEAIRYYELAAERIDDDIHPGLRLLSMQYLVSAFGSDKANDPSRSEPVLRAMILDDPENSDNYYRLAQLYEEAGLFEDAESIFQAVQSFRSDDPVVYLQLAGFYNRAGEFELTIESLEQRAQIEPDNPEAFYTISTFYWEKAFRDFRITQDQKREYILAGLEASDRALALNPRYVDALVYKNILLRMQANETEDLDVRDELIAQADELRSMAEDLQKQQREGAAEAAAANEEA